MLGHLLKRRTGTKLYTDLSKKYNLPTQVIKTICEHPFLFINRRITRQDERVIMLTHLGKIKIKKNYATKDNTNNENAE